MSHLVPNRPAAAGILGCLAFVLIGWASLLVPSLIRSVQASFGQDDGGIGQFYLVYGIAYAAGSIVGGAATERVGRRVVLSGSGALAFLGLAGLALAPDWGIFLVAGVPFGLGAGSVDGGINGLFLDLFRDGRGRALNTLHLFFSLGALAAPVAVGRLVTEGVAWPTVVLGSGFAALGVAVLFALVPMPSGRHARPAPATVAPAPARVGVRLGGPLVLLAFAIACYVASEGGVSSWLVRFLEPAPLETATLALSMLWAGLTVGRLVGARVADRFDHLTFAVTCAVGMSLAFAGAILVPSLPLSIALFGVAGFFSGPVFPMIIAVGGDLYPDRSAAVSGLLAGTAVTGSVVYPPVIGFISGSVGLQVAMLGNVVLGIACAGALVLAGAARQRRIAAVGQASAPPSAELAARQPHSPWTPPPGGVDDEQMKIPGSGVE